MKAINDSDQSKFLRKKTEAYINKNPEIKPLMDKLLSIAGDFVVIWIFETDLEKLLSRGKLFNNPIVFNEMEANHCHKNVSELYISGKGKIVTGWALSSDGLWRQHSWALKDKTIIETTAIREKYFGVVLTEKESELFHANNC